MTRLEETKKKKRGNTEHSLQLLDSITDLSEESSSQFYNARFSRLNGLCVFPTNSHCTLSPTFNNGYIDDGSSSGGSADEESIDHISDDDISDEFGLSSDEDTLVPDYGTTRCLSPIAESSEPTSSKGASIGSSSSSGLAGPAARSSSYNDIDEADASLSDSSLGTSQTFPKCSKTNSRSSRANNCRPLDPLQPRELDAATFYQLCHADSHEELQEFLLLESSCKSDECVLGSQVSDGLAFRERQLEIYFMLLHTLPNVNFLSYLQTVRKPQY